MDKMINDLGNNMVLLMGVVNIFGNSGNKFANELHGMCRCLKAMNIDFEIHYDESVTKFTGLTVMGKRFEV